MNDKPKTIPPHGGDIYAHTLEGSPLPLDFSANISPLGLPEGVRRELAERSKEFEAYPDPYCRGLIAALAEKHNTPKCNIVCGAGSADLIFRIVRAFRPSAALVTAPAFSEYEAALAETGSAVHTYRLTYPDFEIKCDIIKETEKKDMVFLCNPNNPTGVLTERKMITGILEACRKSGAILVLDECFMDLTDDPGAFTAEPLLMDFENLIILKAFTKNYAMAGLRLGYALCGTEETSKRIEATGPPWSVSVPAQIAGVRALKETGYIEELRALIKTERKRMVEGLTEAGFEVLSGTANYVFFRAANDRLQKNNTANANDPAYANDPAKKKDLASAKDLPTLLASRGILIRDCSNFTGLEEGAYYRAAVRLPEENERFLCEIKTIAEELI